MGHTHLNLEVELGYSHLLSNMEIASSREVDAYVINPPSMWMNMDESSEGVVSNDLWWTEEDESLYYVIKKNYFFLFLSIFLYILAVINALYGTDLEFSFVWSIAGTVSLFIQYLVNTGLVQVGDYQAP